MTHRDRSASPDGRPQIRRPVVARARSTTGPAASHPAIGHTRHHGAGKPSGCPSKRPRNHSEGAWGCVRGAYSTSQVGHAGGRMPIRARHRSSPVTARALLLLSVAALVALLAGCGSPEYTYVTNSTDRTYLKVPAIVAADRRQGDERRDRLRPDADGGGARPVVRGATTRTPSRRRCTCSARAPRRPRRSSASSRSRSPPAASSRSTGCATCSIPVSPSAQEAAEMDPTSGVTDLRAGRRRGAHAGQRPARGALGVPVPRG